MRASLRLLSRNAGGTWPLLRRGADLVPVAGPTSQEPSGPLCCWWWVCRGTHWGVSSWCGGDHVKSWRCFCSGLHGVLQSHMRHPGLTTHPLLLGPREEGKIRVYEGFSFEEKGATGDVPGSKWWDQSLSTLRFPCQKTEKLPRIGFLILLWCLAELVKILHGKFASRFRGLLLCLGVSPFSAACSPVKIIMRSWSCAYWILSKKAPIDFQGSRLKPFTDRGGSSYLA